MLVKVTQSVATHAYAFIEGAVLHVTNGQLPEELASFTEPYPSTDVPYNAIHVDAEGLRAGVKRWQQLLAPTPKPAAPLSKKEVCKRMGWTPEELDRAIAFVGFPKGKRLVLDNVVKYRAAGSSYEWWEKEINDWQAHLRALRVIK